MSEYRTNGDNVNVVIPESVLTITNLEMDKYKKRTLTWKIQLGDKNKGEIRKDNVNLRLV